MTVSVAQVLRLTMITLVALIALSSAISALSFQQITHRLSVITREVLPTFRQAAEITELVRNIQGVAATLPTAHGPFEIETAVFRLRDLLDTLSGRIESLDSERVPPTVKADIAESLELARRTIQHLHGLMVDRAGRQTQLVEGLTALRTSRLNLVFAVTADLGGRPEISLARRVLGLVDLTNLAMVEADPTRVGAYQRQFYAERAVLLNDLGLPAAMRDAVQLETANLAPLFAARLEELLLDQRLRSAIDRLVILDRLVDQIDSVTKTLATLTSREIASVETLAALRTDLVLTMTALSLVLGGLAVLYVNRRIVARMRRVRGMMQDHVRGGRVVPPIGGSDEISDMARDFQHFVTTVDDQAREVQNQRDLLHAVMESMPLGVIAFDGAMTLMAVNREFIRIHAYPETLITPGMPLEDLMAYDVTRGEYGPGNPDQQVEALVASARRCERHAFERRRPDGPFLEVRGGPIPGGGFVSTVADITDRKKTEQALEEALDDNRRQKERFRKLTTNLPAMVFQVRFQPSGAPLLTYANPYMRVAFGLPPGSADPQALTDRFFASLHPDDRDRVLGAFAAAASTTGDLADTFRIHDGSGCLRWIEAAARTYRAADGDIRWDGLALDITDRRAAEQALRDSEQTLAAVLESSPVGASIVEDGNRLTYVNPTMATMLGRTRDELLRLPAHTHYIDPADRDALTNRFLSGEAILNEEVTLKRADGTPVHTLLTMASAGEGTRYFSWVYDITERKEAENAVRARVADLEQFTALAVGRELRMIALKREINDLCAALGRPPRYALADEAGAEPPDTPATAPRSPLPLPLPLPRSTPGGAA